jgi:multidrug efflux pump subunit AcrB
MLSDRRSIYKPTSFPIIMATLALMLLGVAMVPLLKVKLMPDRSLPSVSVHYSYGGANAVVVDSEVTTKLEGIFSRLEGLEKLSSRTGDGYGSISLEIDKEADMDAVRFEVATLIRQVYPELPDGVGYPQLRVSRPDEEQRIEQLMSITLNGPGQQRQVGQIAESVIKPRLSLIEGIHEVQVSGYTPMVWELIYDVNHLKQEGIEASAIRARINDYYRTATLGNVKEASGVSGIKYTIPVSFAGLSNDVPQWDDIRVEAGGRFFKLTDLVEVRKGEVEPSDFYRINGLSTISIRVLAAMLTTGGALVVKATTKQKKPAVRQYPPPLFYDLYWHTVTILYIYTIQ